MSHSTLPGLSGRGDDRPTGARSFASARNAKCELGKAPDARGSVDDRVEHTTSAAANNAQRRRLLPTDRRSPAFKRPRLTLRTERRGRIPFPGPRAAPNRTPPRGRVRADGGGRESRDPSRRMLRTRLPRRTFLPDDRWASRWRSIGGCVVSTHCVETTCGREAPVAQRRQSCAGLPTGPKDTWFASVSSPAVELRRCRARLGLHAECPCGVGDHTRVAVRAPEPPRPAPHYGSRSAHRGRIPTHAKRALIARDFVEQGHECCEPAVAVTDSCRHWLGRWHVVADAGCLSGRVGEGEGEDLLGRRPRSAPKCTTSTRALPRVDLEAPGVCAGPCLAQGGASCGGRGSRLDWSRSVSCRRCRTCRRRKRCACCPSRA